MRNLDTVPNAAQFFKTTLILASNKNMLNL